jgi:hypothetical protein
VQRIDDQDTTDLTKALLFLEQRQKAQAVHPSRGALPLPVSP